MTLRSLMKWEVWVGALILIAGVNTLANHVSLVATIRNGF